MPKARPMARAFPLPLQRLQPAARAAHWRIVCRCGVLLAECGCQTPDKPIEVWPDGCAFKARWASPRPPPVVRAPVPVPARPQWGKLQGHEATIAALYAEGWTQQALATRYGVSHVSISLCLKRQRQG